MKSKSLATEATRKQAPKTRRSVFSKALSLFLAAMLAVTLVPLASIAAQEANTGAPADNELALPDDSAGGSAEEPAQTPGVPLGTPPGLNSPNTNASEPEGLEGIMQAASEISPLSEGTEVTNWQQLRAAWLDTTVSEIHVMNDITRTTTGTGENLTGITRDLRVVGVGGQWNINFGTDATAGNAFTLGNRTATQPASFTLENLTITRLGQVATINGGTAANSAGWDITVNNVAASTTPVSYLISAPGAKVTLAGLVDWRATNANTQITCNQLHVADSAKVSLSRNTVTGSAASGALISVVNTVVIGSDAGLNLSGGSIAINFTASTQTSMTVGSSAELSITNASNGILMTDTPSGSGGYCRYVFGPNSLTTIMVVNKAISGTSVVFQANAIANITGTATAGEEAQTLIDLRGTNTTSAEPRYFNALDGAQVTLKTDGGNCIDIGYPEGTRTGVYRATLSVNNGARITATGNGDGIGTTNAVIVACAAQGGITIESGGVIEAHSTRPRDAQATMIQQIPGGLFTVDGIGSQLNLTQRSNAGPLTATLRFRLEDNQTFNVSNGGVVDIHKFSYSAGTKAPAIRFYGTDNDFNITSGGQVFVRNEGLSTGGASIAGGDGEMQAILYTGARFSFRLEGSGSNGPSACMITADRGTAIDAGGNANGNIYIGEGTVFVASGNTGNTTWPVVNATGANFNFTMIKPLYYDFVNTRAGGGRIFNIGSGGVWNSQASDVAVWRRGAEVWNGNPAVGGVHTLIDYQINGGTWTWRSGDATFQAWYGAHANNRMDNYTRISANNAPPEIRGLESATNADRYVRWTGSVPEGLDLDGRAFWDDEVHAIVKVVKANGDTFDALATASKSLLIEDLYAEETNVKTLDGVLRLEKNLSEPTNTDLFLEPGDTYEVIEYWRGPAEPADNDPGFTKRHMGKVFTSTGPVTVTDIVPPLPATSLLPINFYANQRALSGTWDKAENDNSPVTVTAQIYRNDAWSALPGTGVVYGAGNASGSWTFDIESSYNLYEDDIIAIVFTDENGNTQPLADTALHDMVVPAAAKITVQAVQFEITGNNKIISIDDAKLITTPAELLSLIEGEGFLLVPTKTLKDVEVSATDFLYGASAAPGNYSVTVKIKDIDFEENFYVHVSPNKVAVGENYYIEYTNITERKSYQWSQAVTNQALMDEAEVTAYQIISWSGGALNRGPATAEFVSRNIATNAAADTANNFFTARVQEEPAVSANILVNISDSPPTLTATTPVVLKLNDPSFMGDPLANPSGYLDYHKSLGMTATDDVDSQSYLLDNARFVIYSGSVDITTEGIYPVVYGTTDSDGNFVTSNTRYFAVYDADVMNHSSRYLLTANYVYMTVEEARAFSAGAFSGAAYVTAAGANAVRIDGTTGPATAEWALGTVSAVEGVYPVDFIVAQDTSVRVSVKFVVMAGNKISGNSDFAIAANHVYMSVEEAQAFIARGKDFTAEALAHALLIEDSSPADVSVMGAPSFFAAEGAYPVTFEVDADPTVQVSVYFVVMDGNVVKGSDQYAIAANHVYMTIDEARNFLANGANYVGEANAHGMRLSDSSPAAVSRTNGALVAAEGVYRITFAVNADPSAQATVYFVVLAGDEVKGNGEYAIAAFRAFMSLEEAQDFLNEGANYVGAASAHALRLGDETGASVSHAGGAISAAVGVYPITFSVDAAPSVEVTVNFVVYDGDVIDHDYKYLLISANHVRFNLGQAEQFLQDLLDAGDNSPYIDAANAHVMTIDNSPDISQPYFVSCSPAFAATAGTYRVTFCVDGTPSVSVTVNFIVYEGSSITAENVFMTTAQAEVFLNSSPSSDDYMLRAHVWATDEHGSNTATELISGTLVAVPGIYPFVFAVSDELPINIEVSFVVMDGSEIAGNDNYGLAANHVYMTLADAEGFLSGAADYVNRAGAYAITVPEADPATAQLRSGALVAAEGVYNITFEVAEDPSVTVTVRFVVMRGDEIDGNSIYSLAASHVFMSTQEALQFISEGSHFISRADAHAVKIDGTPGVATVAVKGTPAFSVAPGVYPVSFEVAQSIDVYVTVYFVVMDGNVVAGNDTFGIAANHIYMTEDEAAAFLAGAADYVAEAGAHAMRLSNESNALVSHVAGAAQAAEGIYPITFAVDDDPSVTATISFVVMKGDVIDGNDRYAIAANYVYMTLDEATDFLAGYPNGPAYVARANAHAIRTNSVSGSATAIWSMGSVSAFEGTYPVTFYVQQDPTVAVTVQFVVMAGDEIAGNKDYALAANHVFMTETQAAAFLSGGANYVSSATARALVVDASGSATAAWASGAVIATEGIYPITFEVAEDPRVTVTVNFVVMEGDVISGNPQYALAANHVSMTIAEANAFIASSYPYVTAAYAHAKRLSDWSDTAVQLVSCTPSFSAAENTYVVVFRVVADPSITVTVNFVVADNYRIGANHVFMTTAEAEAFLAGSPADAAYVSEAEAWATAVAGGSATPQLRGTVGLLAQEGIYPATFEVAEDPTVSITINFVVKNGDVVSGNNSYALGANYVFMTLAEAQEFLAASPTGYSYVARASAHAVKHGGAPGPATAQWAMGTILALPGVYPVDFVVAQDTSVRVSVKFVVMDADLVGGNTEYALGANHVFLTEDEAAAFLLGGADYVLEAGAHARLVDATGLATAEWASGAVVAAPGIYPITFKVAEDPRVTVTVNFTVMEGDVISGNARYALAASHVYLTVAEAKNFITLGLPYATFANAHALRLSDGSSTAVQLVSCTPDFSEAEGTYVVVFRVVADPSITVAVNFVVADNFRIGASNVLMTTAEAASFLAGSPDSAAYALKATAWATAVLGGTATVQLKGSPTFAAIEGIYPVAFEVAEDPTVTVSVNFVVMDGDVASGNNSYALAANYVFMTVAEANHFLAGGFSGAAYVAHADAHALKIDGTPGPATARWVLGTITAVPGVYPVSFNVLQDPSVAVTVKFVVMAGSVISGNTDYALAANHVFLTTTEAEAFLAGTANYVAEANAHAVVVDASGTATAEWASGAVMATEGIYPISFEVAEDPSVAVTVNFVVMDGSVVGGNDRYALAANHVFLTVREAQAFLAAGADYLGAAEAHALKIEDASSTPVARLSGAVVAAEGVYRISFAVLADPSVTVSVYFVVMAGDRISGNGEYALAAYHVFLSTNEAADFVANGDSYVDAARAHAIQISDATSTAVSHTAGALPSLATSGIYPITFAVDADPTVTVTVNFIVYDGDVYDHDEKYLLISARHRLMNVATAQAFIDAGMPFVTEANAHVMTIDGSPDTSAALFVTCSPAFSAEEGVYRVTFCVEDEPSISVTVNFVVADQYAITAENIFMTVAQAQAFLDGGPTAAKYESLAQVWAAHKDSGTPATPQYESGTIESPAAEGIYPIVFNVKEDPTIKATAQFVVLDSGVIGGNRDYALGADHVFMTVDEAQAFLAAGANYVDAAHARALLIEDASSATARWKSGTLTASEGIYQVSFEVAEDPSVAVTVRFVVMRGDVISGNETYGLAASHVFMTVEQAAAFITAGSPFVSRAAAHALKLDGTPGIATVSVVGSPAFAAAPGVYPISFAVTQDSSVSATVNFVVMQGSVVGGNNEYALAASHIYMTVDEAEGFTRAGSDYVGEANAHGLVIASSSAAAVSHVSGAAMASEGVYRITFAVDADPTVTATINFVVMAGNVIAGNENYALAAYHVFLSVTEAQAFLDAGADYIGTAEAHALRISDEQSMPVNHVSGAVLAVEGVYRITFELVADPSVRVTVSFVVYDGDVFDHDDKFLLVAARHVHMNVATAQAFIANGMPFVDAAGARVMTIDGSPDTSAALFVTCTPAFSDDEGIYEVSFSADGNPAISVTVLFVVADGYSITADNVFFTTAEAGAFLDGSPTGDDYMSLAQVWAADTDGLPAAAHWWSGEITRSESVYPVTFVVTNDTTISATSQFVVMAGDVIKGNKAYALAASHVLMTVAEAEAFLAGAADYAGAARAHALRIDGVDDSATAQWRSGAILAEEGIYSISFEVAEDTDVFVTVHFVVMGGDVAQGNNSYALAANHVFMTTDEAAAFVAGMPTGATYVARANAHALKTDGRPGTATAQWVMGTVGVLPNIYPVLFRVAEDPSVFVTVNFVVMDGDVIDGNKSYAIAASNVSMSVDEVVAFLGGTANYVDLTGANAVAVEADVAPTVQLAGTPGLIAAAGNYPVSFELAEDSTVSVTVNINVYATYSVTFVDWDGTVLKTHTGILHGGAATAPADPARAGHTFSGWDRPFNNVTSNLTVMALHTLIPVPPTFTVTFVDWDGSVLAVRSGIAYGGTATAPADPARTGYTFAGWDMPFNNVTADLTATALYTAIPPTYTVTFVDWDGTVLAVRTGIAYGGAATAPANPARDGYTFVGWDTPFNVVTASITVRAQYTAIPAPQPEPQPQPEPEPTPPPTVVVPPTIVVPPPVTPPTSFTITFVDGVGNTLKTESVLQGGTVTPPADPTRSGFDFAGWDTPSSIWSTVTGNAVITALWNSATGYQPDTSTTQTVSPESDEELEVIGQMLTILGTNVPLFASDHWSLFNLLALLLGALAFILRLVLAATRKKRIDEPTGHRLGYSRINGEWVNAQGQVVDESKEGKHHYHAIPLIASTAVLVIMVVLFALTQNLAQDMALFDTWSVIFAIAFVAVLAAAILSHKRVRVEDDAEPSTQQQVLLNTQPTTA
ncbi:MAG: InlB B-repeat-containing protein [Coriobacteriia bacterium]|nr:InlB B-repeat-containing protein [Coriobacteriia bacterium]